MGCHGNETIRTPLLDRFVSEGAESTQFLVCPNYFPTRASLSTGRYNDRIGEAATCVFDDVALARGTG